MSRIPNKMPIPGAVPAAPQAPQVPDVPVDVELEVLPPEVPEILEKPAPKVVAKSFAPPKFPAMVKATRKGFYKQVRRNVGDEFMCEKAEQLGSWMKLV